MTELTRHIGQRIRLYRKSNGLTLEELAARIHKSKSSVSKYESGDIAVDVETLVEIANALGIDLWQLLDVDQVHNRPAFPDRVPTGFFAKVKDAVREVFFVFLGNDGFRSRRKQQFCRIDRN